MIYDVISSIDMHMFLKSTGKKKCSDTFRLTIEDEITERFKSVFAIISLNLAPSSLRFPCTIQLWS